jgi:hypothetical protein
MVWQVVLTDRAAVIQLVQSAICSPGTLSKSFVFLVSNSACSVRQIAAMRRRCHRALPRGVPLNEQIPDCPIPDNSDGPYPARSCLVCFGSLTASQAGRQTHRFRVLVATLKRSRNSFPPWLFQNLMRLAWQHLRQRLHSLLKVTNPSFEI